MHLSITPPSPKFLKKRYWEWSSVFTLVINKGKIERFTYVNGKNFSLVLFFFKYVRICNIEYSYTYTASDSHEGINVFNTCLFKVVNIVNAYI